jgi:protocatechuate 3,4-dioxygenase beta subunit
MMRRFAARAACACAFALAVLSGRVLDRTTGQGLAHVHVSASAVRVTTDASGHYILRGLKPGATAVTLESDDVPAQHFTVTVGSGTTAHDFRACSTTLDYSCAAPALPGGAGGAS